MNLQDTVRLDLVRLLREVSERCASRAEQSAIEFHLELPADSVELMGSETQMRRALENLLDNALKFTPHKSISTFSQGLQRIQFSRQRPGTGHRETIIEGHGGSIHVENLERGTRFICRLPAGH
ncbi:MAG: hypothetical protein P8Z41_14540 [Anaerolineales bacterium]